MSKGLEDSLGMKGKTTISRQVTAYWQNKGLDYNIALAIFFPFYVG